MLDLALGAADCQRVELTQALTSCRLRNPWSSSWAADAPLLLPIPLAGAALGLLAIAHTTRSCDQRLLVLEPARTDSQLRQPLTAVCYSECQWSACWIVFVVWFYAPVACVKSDCVLDFVAHRQSALQMHLNALANGSTFTLQRARYMCHSL